MSSSEYSNDFRPHRWAKRLTVRLFAPFFLLLISEFGFSADGATVTNPADNGPGTLRAALASATNGEVVSFALSKPATIIVATDLTVDKSLTVLGPGSALLALDGNWPNSSNRVFHVTNGVSLAIFNLAVTHCRADGAILNDKSVLTVSNCLISANHSDHGAILNFGNTTVLNSTLSSNVGGFGGAIGNYGGISSLSVFGCTFSGNVANAYGRASGAAIFNWGGAVANVANSTFSRNSANLSGGDIENETFGGSTANLRVTGSTFSGSSPGAIYSDIVGGGSATLELGDTIFEGRGDYYSIRSSGTVISHGYNLASDAAGGDTGSGPGGYLNGPGDMRNTDPVLEPAGLKDNGGLTQTIALLPGSPAINRGNRAAISDLAFDFDQRGVPRPLGNPAVAGGDGSDIGAFEFVPGLLITVAERIGSDLRITFYGASPGRNYQVESRANLTVGTWGPLGGSTAGSGGATQFTVTNAFGQSQHYYRIHELP